MRRLWHTLRLHRGMVVGAVLVALALAAALFCTWLAPFDPAAQFRQYCAVRPGSAYSITDTFGVNAASPMAGRRLPAGEAAGRFMLGTDVNGRDILSRLFYGARVSLLVGLVATVVNLLIGVLVGTAAAYFGDVLDNVLMRVTDVFFAFPGMLLAIIILATLNQPAVREALVSVSGKVDPGIWGLFIALGLTGWTGIARVIRGQVLSLKEQEFVEAAKAIGCGHGRIVMLHILPNCLAPIIVLATMQVAYNILSEAGLSFLGLGVQPPAASWGGMLAEGRPFLADMPWWGVYPGLALGATVLGFNLFGDGLRDYLDPRLRVRF
jgi:ABC-type dipeptide/oligopeptide/nickel transport system permease subunit